MATTLHASASPALATTVSSDGTEIDYLTLGDGRGLVVLHGAMQSASSQMDLARLLAGERAVHLVNRRGPGRSGGEPATTTATEVADLAAVLEATGARDVLGISSGALIAARGALTLPQIQRLALFEPPIVVDGSLSLDFIDRFARELSAGDVAAAMVTAMLGAQMGPGFMAILPRPILRAMTRRMLADDDRKSLAEGEAHLRDLAACLSADFAVIEEQANHADAFSAISADVMLIGGAKSRPYLRRGIDALAEAVPHARREDLPGADHGATQNRKDRGQPETVAIPLRQFLA
jgi:pimeloyl-ACP methyl ester carboxylesterase